MAISLLVTRGQLSNPKINRLIEDLTDPEAKNFVRVPGESRSGICPFCAQFIFVQHDGSGREVPLPVVGTHDNCVCQDIFQPIFQLNTKASLYDLAGVPDRYKYKIRKAKAGQVERFEWLKYQNKRTLTRILGVTRIGMLKKEIPLEKLYNARTKQPKPIKRG